MMGGVDAAFIVQTEVVLAVLAATPLQDFTESVGSNLSSRGIHVQLYPDDRCRRVAFGFADHRRAAATTST